MKWNCKIFKMLSIVTLIAYAVQLINNATFISILGIDRMKLAFVLPLGGIGFFAGLLGVSYWINAVTFSYSYIFTGTVIGFTMNIFFMCVIYWMIVWFIPFTEFYAMFFTVGIGSIVSIYGLINQQIMRIERITLNYHDFNSKRKICHLSDLHLGAIYQKGFVQRIVNKVMQIKPDVVVITGDMADGTENVKSDWLRPFDTLSMPVLYITGNHEVIMGKELMLKEVNETNIKHIGMTTTPYTAAGMTFLGVDYEENVRQKLNEFPRQLNTSFPTILLNHIPTLKPEDLKEPNVFLMLAGHTHGGQIPPFQPLAWLMNECFEGLYSTQDKKHHVYVSSGLGGSVVPMRIFSKSVIGLITIQGY